MAYATFDSLRELPLLAYSDGIKGDGSGTRGRQLYRDEREGRVVGDPPSFLN